MEPDNNIGRFLLDRFFSFLKYLSVAVGFVGVAYLGQTGKDGGFIRDLWDAAKTASPFAAMFAILFFLDERRERREAQRQCNERTISFVESTNTQATALESLIEAINHLRTTLSRRRRKVTALAAEAKKKREER